MVLTRKQVAERWGGSVWNVDRAVQKGILRKRGYGKFHIDDVDAARLTMKPRPEHGLALKARRSLNRQQTAEKVNVLPEKSDGLADAKLAAMDEAQIKLTFKQRALKVEKLELELAATQSELLHKDEFKRWIDEMIASVEASKADIVERLAPQLAGVESIPEAYAILDREMAVLVERLRGDGQGCRT